MKETAKYGISKDNAISLSTIIGSAIEYYDFVVYIMMASMISQLFFINGTPFHNLMKTFLIFGIAYFIRPLGALIFGQLGDRYGRKRSLSASIVLMAFATFSIGLLPTYDQIGHMSVVMLTLARILQGISQGAELPSALTFASEHLPQEKGFRCSLIFTGATIGSALSSIIAGLLTTYLSESQMLLWGWRIPFIIGGCLAVVGFYIRKHVSETPEFLKLDKPEESKPIWASISQPRQIAYGISVTLPGSMLVIFLLSLPTYLIEYASFDKASIFKKISIGLLWVGIMMPILGRIYDKLDKLTCLKNTCVLMICTFPFVMHYCINLHSDHIMVLILYLQTIIASLAACYPSLLSELFPTHYRNTGLGLSYNISYSIAACLPMLLTYLFSLFLFNGLIIAITLSVITMICLFMMMCLEGGFYRSNVDEYA